MFWFKYDFSFDNNVDTNDVLFENVVIDKTSLDIIAGSVIDFKKEMIGETFVINNPKASASCMWFILLSLMKIISWNVNSVRARINNILDYIKLDDPDILLLQEIKTQEETFPFEDFKNAGYFSYVFGQKSYNGVAIISKTEIMNINKSFIKDSLKQSRIISGEILFKKKKLS